MKFYPRKPQVPHSRPRPGAPSIIVPGHSTYRVSFPDFYLYASDLLRSTTPLEQILSRPEDTA
jgi:hypothetical protein